MANGYLQATVVGNLGQDPELKFAQGGTAVLNLRVCANLRVKKGQEWVDSPTWVGVTTFGKRAEALSKLLSKGAQIMAAGRLEIRDYERRDGGKGTSVSIVADELLLLGGRGGDRAERRESRSSGGDPYAPESTGGSGGAEFGDDDIPFRQRDGRLS